MKKWIILTACIVSGFIQVSSASAQESGKTEDPGITVDHSRHLVQRLFNEVFNRQSLSIIDDIYDSKVVDHSAFPDQAPGVEGIKSAINGFFEIFDDLKVTVEDIIVEKDKVVTREVWKGTHIPSGKTAEGTVIHIFRIHDGRITDEWSRGWDWLENL